ncbi:MAG: acyltransferase family protein [Alphaproteobacteria bacterium]|nr:acyltransferase family protein [Alphaproteobacteria bacterium]
MSQTAITYRPDIDWLRGFAVLSVLFFHAFPAWIPGGYSGVDVFFVISGFLISTIIKQEVEENNFTLRSFYARRIRRIFPALILVMAATLGAGWLLLLDDEYKKLGNHAMRASVFLSNFTLWKEAGYFDEASELKPLLHLWSLAIEEQFYIIWPLMMNGLFKLGAKGGVTLGLLTLASFGWNLYISPIDSTHVYYSPLTRFWELMAGAFLAWHWAWIQSRINATTQEWLGLCGLLILFTGLWFLGHASGFPGAWALAPVLGAMALIASAGQLKWIGTLPAFRLFLWFGAISYPLYLWHWPILSFIRILEGTDHSISIRLSGVVASILLAAFTARWIEPYFRHGPINSRKIILLTFLMTLLLFSGYLINKRDGNFDRLPQKPHLILHQGSVGQSGFFAEIRAHYHECSNQRIRNDSGYFEGMSRCYESKSGQPSRILLLGDSHAEHLFPGFAKLLPDENISFYGKLGLPTLSNPNYKIVFEELKKSNQFEQIIISSHWHAEFNRKNPEIVKENLSGTLDFLLSEGKKIIILDDVHDFEFGPTECKYQRPLSSKSRCDVAISKYREQRSKYMHHLQSLASEHHGLSLVSVADALCSQTRCSMLHADTIAYRDIHHLNETGSLVVANHAIKQFFENRIWTRSEVRYEPPY